MILFALKLFLIQRLSKCTSTFYVSDELYTMVYIKMLWHCCFVLSKIDIYAYLMSNLVVWRWETSLEQSVGDSYCLQLSYEYITIDEES